MLKLNAGFSRKVGEANYSSRGASVNVELEVESNLVNDSQALLDRVRKLFALARTAVDEELSSGQPQVAAQQTSSQATRNGNGNGREGRSATASQLRAVKAIAARLSVDADDAARDVTGARLEQLSLQQASQLIDDLKSRQQAGAAR